MRKLGVWTAKGGAGKTKNSTTIAKLLSKSGMKVGLVDMDITNPNVAVSLGLPTGKGLKLSSSAIIPYDMDGLKVMTLEFMPETDKAMLFDGLTTSEIAEQLLNVVDWGDIDILVIDMAPGTSDLSKYILQTMDKKDGVIVITTPQPEPLSDAKRTLDALNFYQTRIVGLIINMSYFFIEGVTPEKIYIGKKPDEIKAILGLDILAEVPFCVPGQKVDDFIDIEKIKTAMKPKFQMF